MPDHPFLVDLVVHCKEVALVDQDIQMMEVHKVEEGQVALEVLDNPQAVQELLQKMEV